MSKKCKNCLKPFEPSYNSTQRVCGVTCAINLDKKKKVKEFDKETRKRKAAIKPRSKHLGEAQQAFNEYVRYRDKDLLCINEGVPVAWDDNKSDAAHYISRASNGAMRFDLRNVNKSTKKSNDKQEKWIHDYTENLTAKLGQKRFDELMADNKYWNIHKRTFNIDYLIRIKAIFRKKKRVLMKIRK